MSIRIIRTTDDRYWEVMNDADIFAAPTVQAAPVGGGFVVTIPSRDVADWNATLPEVYKLLPVGFEGDDGPVCMAYVNLRDRWNGWLKPLVDRANLQKFLASQDKLAAECGIENTYLTGKLEGDILVVTYHTYDGEQERISPTTVNGVQVWSIGLGMIWDDLTPEPATEEEVQ